MPDQLTLEEKPVNLLQFLKLGGSLITDKAQPRTLRGAVLSRLAEEIAAALQASPEMHLLLGHGSGSFGHVPARQYGTRQGVRTVAQWAGFVEVWREAAALNRHVMEALQAAGLPAIALPASASVTTREGKVVHWNLEPLLKALEAGLLPVVFGDVIFDQALGGTILSTEDLFAYLARQFHPQRVLLAGLEQGVWEDYPAQSGLIPEITPENAPRLLPGLGGSASVDVTGGMASKVAEALKLVEAVPGVEVLIFSGLQPGLVERALKGERLGTWIHR